MDVKLACLSANSRYISIKKTKVLIIFLVGNQKEYVLVNLGHFILHSYIA